MSVVNNAYQAFKINLDGNDVTKYIKSQDWSTLTIDQNDTRMTVAANNSIIIKDDKFDKHYYGFKPRLRGGAVQYTVDLSNHFCGCVAGFYLVNISKTGCEPEDEIDGVPSGAMPSCPSIDVMQANPYSFNLAAHPCTS